jgi:large subunit ribosomal protein L4
MCSDDVIFTTGALEAFLSGPTRGKGAKAVATSTEAEAVVETEVDKDEEAAK